METSDENTALKRRRASTIIIGILCVVCLVSFVYAFVQQGIAKEMKTFAIEQEQNAVKAAEEASKQQKIAELSAQEAMRQHQLAVARNINGEGSNLEKYKRELASQEKIAGIQKKIAEKIMADLQTCKQDLERQRRIAAENAIKAEKSAEEAKFQYQRAEDALKKIPK